MKFRAMLQRARELTTCPRCGNKCLKSQEVCDDCGLIFSRLKYASNKVAKRQLMRFDRDFVVYTKELPSDVKRWKLILYSGLFGLVGAHYFYVGKYGKALLMCLGFVYWIVATILNPILANYMESNYLFVPIGIYGAAWIISFIYVLFKKFKVPVLIDETKMQDEVLAKKADFDRTKQEIIAERKQLESEKRNGNKNGKKNSGKKKSAGVKEAAIQEKSEAEEVEKTEAGKQNKPKSATKVAKKDKK